MHEDAPTKPLMSKKALLEKIHQAFQTLTQFTQELSEDELVSTTGAGTWAWKDTLAHIAAWEQILVQFHIEGKPFDEVLGMSGARYRITSYDEVNEHLYRMYRDLTVDEVRALSIESHERVLAALDAFPDEWLHQPHPALSTGEAASLNWIDYIAANTYEHYEEHLVAS